MAGANGLSSKAGPAKAKSQLNVVRLVRGRGERVMFATNMRTGRATMANSKGEMERMSLEDAHSRIVTLTKPGSGFKVKPLPSRRPRKKQPESEAA